MRPSRHTAGRWLWQQPHVQRSVLRYLVFSWALVILLGVALL